MNLTDKDGCKKLQLFHWITKSIKYYEQKKRDTEYQNQYNVINKK